MNGPVRLANWNSSAFSEPLHDEKPKDADALAAIIRNGNFPSPVRAAGHFHSLNRCIEADGGTQVRMDHFDRISIDPANHRVTVGAGVSLLRIAEALLPDFQLPVMPEIGNATAGSIACCGTKDSSLGSGPGQVSSTVEAITYLDEAGQRHSVTEQSDPPRLKLLRSSYGLVGVIVEVTFRIEPAKVVLFDYQPLPANPLPSLAEVRGGADGFLAFLEPYNNKLIVERRTLDPENRPITTLDRLQCQFRSFLWETGGSLLASAVRRLRTPLLPPGNPFRTLLDPSRLLQDLLDDSLVVALDPLQFRARRADTMIDFGGTRSHYFDFTFWAFPASSWATVVPDYLQFCDARKEIFRPSLPTEIYSISRDDRALLSVSSDEDVFTLDMVHHRGDGPFDPRWISLNQEFNEFAARRGGRPLLNQTKELTPTIVGEVRSRNPALDKGWKALAASAKPRFMSGYFQTLVRET